MVSEEGRFIHGSRPFTTSWLLSPSLFPLGEVFFTIHSVVAVVVSNVFPFTYPPLWDLGMFVCKLSGWNWAHVEENPLSYLSRALPIPWGEDFLSEITEHSFGKNGHPLLSVWALDFAFRCHGDVNITKLDTALFWPTPGKFPASCVLSPFSLNMFSSII